MAVVTLINDWTALRDAVADYAHNTSTKMLDRIGEYFIPLANVRIGTSLRALSNEKTETYDAEVPPLTLPVDYAQVRSFSVIGTRGRRVLQSRSAKGVADVGRLNLTDPEVYTIERGAVIVEPGGERDWELDYWAAPTLSESSPTDPSLTAHPQVFLYGALVELAVWTRNEKLLRIALEAFGAEIAIANKIAARARGSAPRGVASR